MDRDVLQCVTREFFPWGIELYIRDKRASGIVYDGVRRMLNLQIEGDCDDMVVLDI